MESKTPPNALFVSDSLSACSEYSLPTLVVAMGAGVAGVWFGLRHIWGICGRCQQNLHIITCMI